MCNVSRDQLSNGIIGHIDSITVLSGSRLLHLRTEKLKMCVCVWGGDKNEK